MQCIGTKDVAKVKQATNKLPFDSGLTSVTPFEGCRQWCREVRCLVRSRKPQKNLFVQYEIRCEEEEEEQILWVDATRCPDKSGTTRAEAQIEKHNGQRVVGGTSQLREHEERFCTKRALGANGRRGLSTSRSLTGPAGHGANRGTTSVDGNNSTTMECDKVQ